MFRYLYYTVLFFLGILALALVVAHKVPDPDIGASPESGKPRCEVRECNTGG